MSRALAKSWLWSVFLSLLPAIAFAQSAITGVVKDATGAVLVGVSVEAASDALIERVRAAVTDSQGVYRIVDLRPGTYAVTFSLQGFRGFKREGSAAAVRVHGHRQRRARPGPGGRPRDRHRQLADGGHDDGGAHARAQSRGNRPDSHRPHHSRHGAAHRRHQLEPARHRRRAGHAADLHEHARDVDRQQHRDGGRHARERAAARRRRAELLQRRDESGSELSDERHRRRHGRRRRAPQHDSARGRQPVQRRLQGVGPARRVAVGQPHRPSPRARADGGQRHRSHRGLHRGARRPAAEGPAVVLHLGALLLGEQLRRQHVHRRRQPGHRRPVHQERAGAPDVAAHAAQQGVGVFRRDRQVPRPRHAEQRGSRDRLAALVLARLQHRRAQVDVHGEQPHAHRGRLLTQPRVLHEQLPGGRREDALLAGMVRQRVTARERSRRPQDRRHQPDDAEPRASQPPGGGVVRHRRAQLQGRVPVHLGRLLAHRGRQRRPHAAVPAATPPACATRCPTA